MVFDLLSASSSSSLANSSTFDHQPMFHPSDSNSNSSSTLEPPLSDERDLAQIENAQKQQQQQQQPGKWKMLSKRRQSCTSDLYAIAASRYHRFKPSAPAPITSTTILATPPPSTSDEILPMSNDDLRFFPASISNRRSTTDCNDLLTLNHSRRLGNMEATSRNLLTIADEESRDALWPSTDDQHLLVPTSVPETPSLTRFYSDPSITPISPTSSSSASSFNLHSNSTDLSLSSQYSSSSISFFNDLADPSKTLSSSSGYESNVPTSNSSLNSIPDHLFLASPDSIIMPPPATPPSRSTNDRNLVEQFIDLRLQKQNSFDQDVVYSPPSSFSSSSSSFHSQAALSTKNSPVCCRKCANHDDQQQLSSDTEDDSQSTTISSNLLPLQQQNKRPRSLPIAIQQPKGVNIGDTTEDEDEDESAKSSSRDNSLTCHCSAVSSRKKRFRTCDLSSTASANGLFAENTFASTATDKLHIDFKDLDDSNSGEHSPIKSTKNSLEHFIMSPTDKVKVQMKYPSTNNDRESDTRSVRASRDRVTVDLTNVSLAEWIEDFSTWRHRFQTFETKSDSCPLPKSTSTQQYSISGDTSSTNSPIVSFSGAFVSRLQQNSAVLPTRTAPPGHCDSPLATRTSNPRLLRRFVSSHAMNCRHFLLRLVQCSFLQCLRSWWWTWSCLINSHWESHRHEWHTSQISSRNIQFSPGQFYCKEFSNVNAKWNEFSRCVLFLLGIATTWKNSSLWYTRWFYCEIRRQWTFHAETSRSTSDNLLVQCVWTSSRITLSRSSTQIFIVADSRFFSSRVLSIYNVCPNVDIIRQRKEQSPSHYWIRMAQLCISFSFSTIWVTCHLIIGHSFVNELFWCPKRRPVNRLTTVEQHRKEIFVISLISGKETGVKCWWRSEENDRISLQICYITNRETLHAFRYPIDLCKK